MFQSSQQYLQNLHTYDSPTVYQNSHDNVQLSFLLQQLFSHLISIYNFVVSLEAHQEALYQAAFDERNAYLEYYRKASCEHGFGITTEDEIAHKFRIANFHQFLNTTKLKVTYFNVQTLIYI